MAIVRCWECNTLIDLDENLDEWDFDKEVCRRCIESKQLIERVEE